MNGNASLYKSLIRPLMEYGDVIWNNCCDCDEALLDSVQYDAARLVTGTFKGPVLLCLMKNLLRSLLVVEGNYILPLNT